jgi:hypothetical protein
MNLKDNIMDMAEATAVMEMIKSKDDFKVTNRFGVMLMEFEFLGYNDYICELTGDYYSTNILFNISEVEIGKEDGRNFLRMDEAKVYIGV